MVPLAGEPDKWDFNYKYYVSSSQYVDRALAAMARPCSLSLRSLWFVVSLFLLSAFVPTICSGQAEAETDSLRNGPWVDSSLLRTGRQLVREGQFRRAVRLLRPPLNDTSASHTTDDKERMAHWLGQAYLGQGQPLKAFKVLREGGEGSLCRGDVVSPRLADVFIHEAMSADTKGSYRRAAAAYLRLINRSGDNSLSDEDRAVVHRHLREAAVVLPEGIRKQAGISFDPRDFEIGVEPKPDAGDILVKWWRRQDPIPSTRRNERIHEHLKRVVYARENFSHEGTLDDRGKVYIRFGEPHRDVSIGMKHVETLNAMDTRLRRNVFWTYHHVHPKAYYLFVEIDPNNFQIGGAQDLFPPDMRTGVTGAGASSRSREKALDYLYEMEEALTELATFHADYSTRAADVFNRAAWARDNEQFGIGPDPVDGPAGDFVQSMESRIKSIERQNASERIEQVPQSYTKISEDLPGLPIAWRTARFLTPEGDTRVEMYWSAPTSAFALTKEIRERIAYGVGSSPTSMVRAVAVQEGKDYIAQATRRKRFLVKASGSKQSILPPQTFSMVAKDSLFHLAMQWDQYSIREAGDNVQTGPVLRRQTDRRDTLTALSNDPETLEMSDLKVLTVPDSVPAMAVTSDAAIPYPFKQIRTEAPLALAFQIYHLGLNQRDLTRYTISYGVRQQIDDGGFLGLFGGDDEKETTTTTTYEGDSRRTDEYILLNLDDFVGDSAGSIEITVSVTDEVTGQQVERSISIETVGSDKDE